jgi:hypothetical protein
MFYTSSLCTSIFILSYDGCELNPKHVVQCTMRHRKSAAVIDCPSSSLVICISQRIVTLKDSTVGIRWTNKHTQKQINQKILGQSSVSNSTKISWVNWKMKDSSRNVDTNSPLPVASTNNVQPFTTHTFPRVALFTRGTFKEEDQIVMEWTLQATKYLAEYRTQLLRKD